MMTPVRGVEEAARPALAAQRRWLVLRFLLAAAGVLLLAGLGVGDPPPEAVRTVRWSWSGAWSALQLVVTALAMLFVLWDAAVEPARHAGRIRALALEPVGPWEPATVRLLGAAAPPGIEWFRGREIVLDRPGELCLHLRLVPRQRITLLRAGAPVRVLFDPESRYAVVEARDGSHAWPAGPASLGGSPSVSPAELVEYPPRTW